MVVALALPRTADAEPTAQEKETARALMDQGDERFEQQNYAGALEAYLGAHAIMRVPTTALEVAKVQEKLGRLVEARDALLEAIRYPKTPNEPLVYATARTSAEQQAVALGERIPSIVVRIKGQPKDALMKVTVDGVVVPPAAASLPFRVNPGRHHVVVSSEDTTTGDGNVDVAERESKVVDVTVVARPRPAKKDAAPETRSSPFRTVGLVTAGAGVAGLVVGTAFGISASSKQDDADCPGNVCRDDASAEMLRSANDAATASNIAFLVGGVLTVAGVTMWLLAPKGAPQTAIVGPRGLVMGRF